MSDEKLQLGFDYVRVEVIAQLFGKTVRRIQQLTQEGILPTTETESGCRYELVPTIQRYIEYLSNKAYGRNKSQAEQELKQQKLKAEIDLKELQSEYRKIQNDIAAGKFIDIKEVESDYRRFFVTFKRFALGIPGKISLRLNGICDNPLEIRAIESELNHDIITLLNNFVVAGHQETIEEAAAIGNIKKKTNAKNKKVHRS